MKKVKSKNFIKQITFIIIILMLCNFIIPITVNAIPVDEKIDYEVGGDFFHEEYEFESEWRTSESNLKYLMFTPSNVMEDESIPLVVWLHGAGELESSIDPDESPCTVEEFEDRGMPQYLNEFMTRENLDCFKAYVICPRLSNGAWSTESSLNKFRDLLDEFIRENNIDTKNIILTGHSLGAQGALLYAHEMPEYFSKLVVFCPFPPWGYNNYTEQNVDISEIAIPTKGYIGYPGGDRSLGEKGEEPGSVWFTKKYFEPYFDTTWVDEDHGQVPRNIFLRDEDGPDGKGDGRSDIIEWMFEGYNQTNKTNKVHKPEDIKDAGELYIDLMQLFCFVPDVAINTLQKMFVNPNGIKKVDGTYEILYSPGTIFSGEIPAFDINFIEPKPKKVIYETAELDKNMLITSGIKTEEDIAVWKSFIKALELDDFNEVEKGTGVLVGLSNQDLKSKYGCESSILAYVHGEEARDITEKSDPDSTYNISEHLKIRDDKLDKMVFWVYDGSLYMYQFYDTPWTANNEWFVYKCDLKFLDGESIVVEREAKTYESSAQILQTTISTWYKALRRIALVGLLSVLLYIGIRILLTSTSAKDKAKYKNMLKDWLIALCILFTLHYIMNITVTVVEQINEVLKTSAISSSGEDILMTTIRNQIANGNDFGEVCVEIILYCVLGVYTIIFTIQYFRRTIYLAFLTMIAPLITLTYPLDKIKDSKSQAFDMWLKDYIFFTLLQVIHLIIYYILVGSSMDLMNDGNWVYAIVAIGFMTQAEKITKKMFGFEKSKTMGALAAGATGALVMNAINKIKAPSSSKKSGNTDEKGKGSSDNVRTATKDPLEILKNGGAMPSGGVTGASISSGTNGNILGSSNGNKPNQNKPKKDIWGATLSLGKKYTGPALAKLAGGVLGGTGAIIGLAAGIAQGDLGAAATGLIAGAGAGNALGKGLVNGGIDLGKNLEKSRKNLVDTAIAGAYDEEYAQNRRFDKEFMKGSTYKALRSKYGESLSKDDIISMLDAGITEKGAMEAILDNSGGNIDGAIAYYTLAKNCPDTLYYDDQKLEKWLKIKGVSSKDVATIKDNMKKFK